MRQNLDTGGPTPAELAAKNVALRAKLKELEAEKKVSEVQVQAEEAKNAQLKKTLQAKEDQIDLLVRMLLGPTSEHRSWESLEPEAQLWLEGMALELPESPPSRRTTVKEHERERRKDPTDVV